MGTIPVTTQAPRRPVLYPAHHALRAKFATFGGWEMPLYYTSILREHQAVRTACGLFDVSHLGQLEVVGPAAESFLQQVMTQDLSRLADGQAAYMPMCNEQGGILDEMIIYRLAAGHYRLVVNAGNAQRDLDWLREHGRGGAELRDLLASHGILAIQGPQAQRVAERLTGESLGDVGYYHCRPGRVLGRDAVIARTGYTGEDGFELMLRAEDLPAVWESALSGAGKDGLRPAGLGARDTLRLEAGMPLYGSDIDETTTPFEVGIGRTVAFGKVDFIGRTALWRQSQEGPRRRLAGFSMDEPGVPRHGYPVLFKDRPVGQVTSGTYSPTLKRNIGLAYLTTDASVPGTTVAVVIHDRPTRATVVQLPFYKRHG